MLQISKAPKVEKFEPKLARRAFTLEKEAVSDVLGQKKAGAKTKEAGIGFRSDLENSIFHINLLRKQQTKNTGSVKHISCAGHRSVL